MSKATARQPALAGEKKAFIGTERDIALQKALSLLGIEAKQFEKDYHLLKLVANVSTLDKYWDVIPKEAHSFFADYVNRNECNLWVEHKSENTVGRVFLAEVSDIVTDKQGNIIIDPLTGTNASGLVVYAYARKGQSYVKPVTNDWGWETGEVVTRSLDNDIADNILKEVSIRFRSNWEYVSAPNGAGEYRVCKTNSESFVHEISLCQVGVSNYTDVQKNLSPLSTKGLIEGFETLTPANVSSYLDAVHEKVGLFEKQLESINKAAITKDLELESTRKQLAEKEALLEKSLQKVSAFEAEKELLVSEYVALSLVAIRETNPDTNSAMKEVFALAAKTLDIDSLVKKTLELRKKAADMQKPSPSPKNLTPTNYTPKQGEKLLNYNNHVQ